MYIRSYTYCMIFPVVPDFMVMLSPPQVPVFGRPQTIDCTVNTVDGVESSSVVISWMGPGGVITTTNGRVSVGSVTDDGNNMYTRSLQFTYLMEGDNGTYTCNVMILDTSGAQSYDLRPLMCKLCTLFCYAYHKLTCNLIIEFHCTINHTSLIANYQNSFYNTTCK